MGRLSAHYTCALCEAPAPTIGKDNRFVYATIMPPTSLGRVNPQPSCSGHADFMIGPDGNLRPLGRSAKLAS